MEVENENLFGWGRITPKCLQVFHKPRCLLASLCLCSITQGMLINGLVPISLSTLEKRFALSSLQSSLFAVSYDIAITVSLIPVTHFGGKGHKGRWLAVGMLIMAIGSVVITLPQFISEPFGESNVNLSRRTSCLRSEEINSKISNGIDKNLFYFLLLLVGQILHGVGGTPIYTLGITFLDESVEETKSAFFLGIFLGSSVLGPVLGFIGGGMFLRIHGDWLKVDTQKYQHVRDEEWYGAWWLAFLMAACMSLVAAFFMSGFAAKLPDAPERKIDPQLSFAAGEKGLLQNILRLFTTWTFVWLIAVDCLEGLLSTGVINFFPKIIENFFSVSASTAGLVTGGTLVPSAVVGTVFGGWIVKKLELHVPGMCVMSFTCDFFCLLFGLSFLIHCPIRDIVGVTKPYGYLPKARDSCSPPPVVISLNHSCNSKFKCSQSCWEPVCDPKRKLTYYSPCFAGCTGEELQPRSEKTISYTECDCVKDPYEKCTDISERISHVIPGFCTTSCLLIIPFLILFSSYVLLAFLTSIPIQESELRSVPFDLRSLAFGIRWICIRLLGTIPGPLLVGAFVDQSCFYWQKDSTGGNKGCVLYNNKRLSTFIVVCGAILKCQILLCIFFAWKTSRKKSVIGPSEKELPLQNIPTAFGQLVKDQAVQSEK